LALRAIVSAVQRRHAWGKANYQYKGVFMKLLIPVSLAFALAVSAMAQYSSSGSQSSGSQSGQSQSGQSTTGSQSGQSGQTDQTTQGSQSSQTSQSDQSSQMGGKHKQKKMSGKVSSDDKSITTSDNKTYTVDNPDALKGQEGQQVALIVQLDPDTNTVHIIQVAPPTPQQP